VEKKCYCSYLVNEYIKLAQKESNTRESMIILQDIFIGKYAENVDWKKQANGTITNHLQCWRMKRVRYYGISTSSVTML
jgi:hypothetical protein